MREPLRLPPSIWSLRSKFRRDIILSWKVVQDMPVYEYCCKHCGASFEYLQLHSSPAARCPTCSGQDLEQLISACGISSEGSRQANLSAQHRNVAAIRQDRVRGEHRHLHEHFEDSSH